MTRPRYRIIPAGILVARDGLGLAFRTKKSAEKAMRTMNRKHPLAGYQIERVAK